MQITQRIRSDFIWKTKLALETSAEEIFETFSFLVTSDVCEQHDAFLK